MENNFLLISVTYQIFSKNLIWFFPLTEVFILMVPFPTARNDFPFATVILWGSSTFLKSAKQWLLLVTCLEASLSINRSSKFFLAVDISSSIVDFSCLKQYYSSSLCWSLYLNHLVLVIYHLLSISYMF